MNIYLITQNQYRTGYDMFDAVIVAAENESDAKTIHPSGDWDHIGWCNSPEYVLAKLIGKAEENIVRGVILASFNAG